MKNQGNLLDALFELRDRYREQAERGMKIVRGDDLPWEINRQGKMRWYLHPAKNDTVIRSLMIYVQEIEPGGHSGKEASPGGIVHYMLEGKGYVVVNGKKHAWAKGDCVGLPILSRPVEYQFFNTDKKKPARYIAATPNLFEVLGVDMGTRFEQLESASVFATQNSIGKEQFGK
ncbi:MAG TPA: cupin domain-containing protein [Candidatus Udaeobacter sp.]|jgi:gentisate 1,2-dioxygenase|nr:cupin domain-containing protein [Candidatus Udaeobacter sp.]